MNKYTITFDKSNEDIPTLIVARDSYFSLTPSMDIINVITGDEAVRIFNKITNKAESEVSDEYKKR